MDVKSAVKAMCFFGLYIQLKACLHAGANIGTR